MPNRERKSEFSARSANQLFEYDRQSEIHEEIVKELSPPTQERIKNSIFEKCSPRTKKKYTRVQRMVLRKIKKAEIAFNLSRRAPNSPRFSTPHSSNQKLTRARLATPTDHTPGNLTPIAESNIGGLSQSEDEYYEDPYHIDLSPGSQDKLSESDILNPTFTDNITSQANQAIKLIQESTFEQGSVETNSLTYQGRLTGDFRNNTTPKTSAGNSLIDHRVLDHESDKTRVSNSPTMQRTPPETGDRQLLSQAAMHTAHVAAAVAQIPITEQHNANKVIDLNVVQDPFQPQSQTIPRSPIINPGNTTPKGMEKRGGGDCKPSHIWSSKKNA